MSIKKLRRVVLKEELAELTGDWLSALVLNQFIYWSERVRDFDRFLLEERERNEHAAKTEMRHGWIYKSSDQLSDELMGCSSSRTIRRRIESLVESGWLSERTNPKYKWDRTLQYRVDIVKVQRDLAALGYALEDYPLSFAFDTMTDGQDTVSDQTVASDAAIPETTTETTTETTAYESSADYPANETVSASGEKLKRLRSKFDNDPLAAMVNAQVKLDENNDRPKGWREATEGEYAVCQRVAVLWTAGKLPWSSDDIEKHLAAANELIELHAGDVRATLNTIDEYHHSLDEWDSEIGFNVSGPYSLRNVVPAFIGKRKKSEVIKVSQW